jgi:hypothetical protein
MPKEALLSQRGLFSFLCCSHRRLGRNQIMIDIIIGLAISAYIGSHLLEEEVEYEEYEPDDTYQ